MTCQLIEAAQAGDRKCWCYLLFWWGFSETGLGLSPKKLIRIGNVHQNQSLYSDLLCQYHKITFFLCYHTIMWVHFHLRSQWLVQHMKRRCQKWRYWGSGGFTLLAQTLFSKGERRCLQICSFSKTRTLWDWNNWLFISQEHLACEWDYYYEFCYCTSTNLKWVAKLV